MTTATHPRDRFIETAMDHDIPSDAIDATVDAADLAVERLTDRYPAAHQLTQRWTWSAAAGDALQGTQWAPPVNRNRIIVAGTIEPATATEFAAAIEAAPGPVVEVLIDSPGGSLTAGVEMGQTISAAQTDPNPHHPRSSARLKAHTIAIRASSAAAWVAACGAPGHRMILDTGTVLVHDVRGERTEAELELTGNLTAIKAKGYARLTGKGTAEEWRKLMALDTPLDAVQAVQLGLVDRVVTVDADGRLVTG